MARGIICQSCGVEAPSQYVEFYYNIGMLVVRSHRYIKGNLCKRCIHKYFWRYSLMDITVGWWGMISVVITPIFLINNIARYLFAIPLPATPAGAQPPRLTEDAVQRLNKYVDELAKRLIAKEPLNQVAESIARTAGVTPGQVILFARAAFNQQTPPPQPQVRGFPVMPVQGGNLAGGNLQGGNPQAGPMTAQAVPPSQFGAPPPNPMRAPNTMPAPNPVQAPPPIPPPYPRQAPPPSPQSPSQGSDLIEGL